LGPAGGWPVWSAPVLVLLLFALVVLVLWWAAGG